MRVDTSAQHLATDQNARPLQGVLWTLQGSAFYSLLFIFPNLWGEGLSPYQLAWFRFVGGFVSLTPLMLYFVLSGQSARTYWRVTGSRWCDPRGRAGAAQEQHGAPAH